MQLRKLGISTLGIAGALMLTAGVVHAATSTDTDDHFSVAAGTTISGSLKSGTSMVFKGTIDGIIPLTVTCKSFSASGKVPAKGLSVTLTAPPTIGSCTDSLGGTDTITTNHTNGSWKLVEVDAPNDESATEPNKGDKAQLVIPKAGATFSSSVETGCVITVAPTAGVKVSGPYNDAGTATVTNAKLAVSGAVCTASGTTVSATLVLSTPVHDVS